MKASVRIVLGSIVEQEADVIVNSANTALVMGGGVAAAVLAEAGPEVEEEAMRRAPVQVGEVVVTGAGNLNARHVVHVAVVGEVPPDVEECTRNALEAAAELGARSAALPAIGTGSAGVSVREAARGMCSAIADHVTNETTLEDIRIVLWDDEYFPVFQKELRRAGLED
jgi:O-acetyl-ADP-ribose deacetylase (regulator of RNase III)